ncbi:nucleoside transporter-domain-containing protein [Fomitopsis serialis]|uniref:nucleoside transporter-domain-containing protein n=1 Tax=Fomitopsis serialis TaxID=139415 RepID=UPI002007EF22|nr:nucleoside transporter-domain-containing protein [Neoantrodia serialis]KAH9938505.1 nucleoside transporter-domain-containing protein [Neoantrodia serialis]
MSGRVARRSSSLDAEYQPIPQAPAVDEEDGVDILEDAQEVVVDGKIRAIYFVLGCAVLLPWNAMITATPYFMSRLDGTSLKASFSSYLSMAFMVPNLIFLGHATATSKQSLSTGRISWSLLLIASVTAALTLSTWIHIHPGLFFALILLAAMLKSAAGSYLQSSVVALASLFGHEAMQAVMSGQAAVGVAVSGVQVLSAAASTHRVPPPPPQTRDDDPARTPEEASASLFLFVTYAVHVWLKTLPAYKQSLPDSDPPWSPDERRGLTQMLRLGRINLPYNFAVAYVFMVTLSVFPPITVSIQSTNPDTHPLLFSAFHFFVYNVGDLTGRTLCSFPRLHVWSAKRLLTFSLARTLFIPLFLLCNIQWASPTAVKPVITSDALYMLILLLFGATNGFTSSMCMMSAPSVAHNPRLKGRTEDVDVAATVASFCLVIGLTMGSVASFAVRAMVCNCNPFRN